MQRSILKRDGSLICFDDQGRTNEQAIEVLRKNNQSRFAQDLIAQHESRGRRLSEKQWSWVHYLCVEEEPKLAMNGRVPRIHALMTTVDLLRPRLRFDLLGSVVDIKRTQRGKVIVCVGSDWVATIDSDGRVLLEGRPLTDDVKATLLIVEEDPIGAATLHGQRVGSCCFCSKLLTTNESVSVGYGPVCAERWGLPWGKRSAKTLIEETREQMLALGYGPKEVLSIELQASIDQLKEDK